MAMAAAARGGGGERIVPGTWQGAGSWAHGTGHWALGRQPGSAARPSAPASLRLRRLPMPLIGLLASLRLGLWLRLRTRLNGRTRAVLRLRSLLRLRSTMRHRSGIGTIDRLPLLRHRWPVGSAPVRLRLARRSIGLRSVRRRLIGMPAGIARRPAMAPAVAIAVPRPAVIVAIPVGVD